MTRPAPRPMPPAMVSIRPDAVIVHFGSPAGTTYTEPEVGSPNNA